MSVAQRVQFKVLCFVFKVVHKLAPAFVAQRLSPLCAYKDATVLPDGALGGPQNNKVQNGGQAFCYPGSLTMERTTIGS